MLVRLPALLEAGVLSVHLQDVEFVIILDTALSFLREGIPRPATAWGGWWQTGESWLRPLGV